MESFLSNCSVSEIMSIGFGIGILFIGFGDLINSLICYLQNKAWFIYDYERIIYLLNKENCMSFTNKDFEIMYKAIDNYEKILKRIEKREKFLNKFRKNK